MRINWDRKFLLTENERCKQERRTFSLLAYVETSRLTNSPRTINIPSDKREEGKKKKRKEKKRFFDRGEWHNKERKKERKEGRIFLSRTNYLKLKRYIIFGCAIKLS